MTPEQYLFPEVKCSGCGKRSHGAHGRGTLPERWVECQDEHGVKIGQVCRECYQTLVCEDPEACPGCGCKPGDGITETCGHPFGCGYHKMVRE